MLNSVDGYYISAIANTFFVQEFDLGPFPQGTNVYANIALSQANTLFASKFKDFDDGPVFAATAFIESWTTYNADGTESAPHTDVNFTQNAIALSNCARIKFVLVGDEVASIAQVNVFKF